MTVHIPGDCGIILITMTDQIKKAEPTKSDTRFALVRASRACDLVMEFNAHEKPTVSFAGTPCCTAFQLARETLDIIGVDGAKVVEMAVSCGECTPKDLARYIQEIADDIARDKDHALEHLKEQGLSEDELETFREEEEVEDDDCVNWHVYDGYYTIDHTEKK